MLGSLYITLKGAGIPYTLLLRVLGSLYITLKGAGIPYTLLLRIEAIGFPTFFGFCCSSCAFYKKERLRQVELQGYGKPKPT